MYFFKRKQIPYNIEKKDENNKKWKYREIDIAFSSFLVDDWD